MHTAPTGITAREAARRLGVSIWTVYRRLDAGELAEIPSPGGRRIVDPASLPSPSGTAAA